MDRIEYSPITTQELDPLSPMKDSTCFIDGRIKCNRFMRLVIQSSHVIYYSGDSLDLCIKNTYVQLPGTKRELRGWWGRGSILGIYVVDS